MSGYIDCACRDCFDIAIGPLGTLCQDCRAAGCDAFYTDCRRAPDATDDFQAMRDCAESHNLQVWRDTKRVITCDDCGDYDLPAEHVDYRTRELDGATLPKCPSCGNWATDGGPTGVAAWWWQTCSPGCLPDSDVMGPFDSEVDALTDATEGLLD